MGWEALPVELQLEVVRFLNREDLKNLRLVAKRALAVATPALFEIIHISPNSSSFTRAYRVASDEQLAKNVTKLVYHVGTLEDLYVNNFPTFREEIMEQHWQQNLSLHMPSFEESWVKTLYDHYLDEIQAQQDFNNWDEVRALEGLVEKLPHLESVMSLLDEYSPFGPPDGYIERRTGMPTSIDDAPHSERLLRTIIDLPLKTVSLEVLGWYVLPRLLKDQNELRPNFPYFMPQTVRHLHLGLFNSELIEFSDPTNIIDSFSVFLASTRDSVTSLSLDFDELPYNEPPDLKLQSISDAIFTHTWPRLSSLSLRGIVSSEDPFIDFIWAHSSTLKSLYLADIEILNHARIQSAATAGTSERDGPSDIRPPPFTSNSTSPGSVISLFYRLHASPVRLSHVRLSGNFTNRYTEAWYVGSSRDALRTSTTAVSPIILPTTTTITESTLTNQSTPISTTTNLTDPTSTSNTPSPPIPPITTIAATAPKCQPFLRARFESFLCHTGPSPFPPWDEYMALQRPRYELKTKSPEEQAEIEEKPVREDWEDLSWEWSPELLEA